MKNNNNKISYKDSGVDVDAGNEFVNRIKNKVAQTFTPNVLTGIGGFGALFKLDINKYKEPILVSSTDGVGTKLKIAFMTGKHDTVGQDLVAMCVNDLIVQGAEPLFFLDYFACGKLDIKTAESVVSGIADGCKIAGCSLIGGETAEMPSMYGEGEYDLAGFSIGAVDKDNVITGKEIKPGDIVLGLASSGVHSNGYSLVRKIIFEKEKLSCDDIIFDNITVGEELLTPTKIYITSILEVLKKVKIKGMVHITGGGFYENIPRVLPENVSVDIEKKSFDILPIFKYLQKTGNVSETEMFRTFNMGIGMILILDKNDADIACEILSNNQEKACVLGQVVCGDRTVNIK